jgi:myo-inositol-1-phosphate synthase
MVSPVDFVISGWDINSRNLGEAMENAEVFDYDLQKKLYPYMEKIKPLPSIYIEDFIALNQKDRANNLLTGTIEEQMNQIRKDIKNFKEENELDKVIVLWTANTERFSEIKKGLNDTSENLLSSIKNGEKEISPSTLFSVAAILEGCSFINGSPQNTLVPGVVQLALEKKVYVAGVIL